MPRNRTIYNVEGLFVGPYSGEQAGSADYFLNGFQILKRIEKVQTFNYAIDNNIINLGSFASKTNVFEGLASQPTVNFSFKYIMDGVTNENRLNFDVQHFSGSGQSLNTPMFSGICIDNSIQDKKDFYLAINNSDEDLYRNYSINNNSIRPTSISDVIDPFSTGYSILHFQNCFLTEYSFDVSVGQIPTVEQKYVADNLIYYISGSGIKYSTLNLISGNRVQESPTLIVPRYLNPTGANISGNNILTPNNANVTFLTQNQTGVLFYNETLQGINFNLPFPRQTLRSLNYKFPIWRSINFPLNSTLNLNFLAEEQLSGSFFETLNKEESYTIRVGFSGSRRGADPTFFVFSGCKFNSINYTDNIGQNKTLTANFSLSLDPTFSSKGIFASGNVLYGIINSVKKVLMY